ncbi:conserved hypothetical protein [Nitrosococcus halophilus Nc 4]|uniref:DUF2970 domain-containing protein n=1 Tax=Nitrosococcus halophilus (strain Nc4) TaxID=472759 RepID=D5C490_NITHN|nr:DUF2970 domain-containing protein [Nitrosococcus halophilus]ADE13278.1 conserved hypothetical protein [Nitrosococcus halophilus Nc 4]
MQSNDTPPTLVQVFKSVFSAMIGVQNRRNHERDFNHGRPTSFIFAGIVAVTLFVLTLVGLVQLILHLAST